MHLIRYLLPKRHNQLKEIEQRTDALVRVSEAVEKDAKDAVRESRRRTGNFLEESFMRQPPRRRSATP